MKIGLIIGGGDLPLAVLEGCKQAGHEVFIAAIAGFADQNHEMIKHAESFGLAKFGAITKAFKRENCTHVCFSGIITRPDFTALKPDFRGWQRLPGAIAAARQGDDALLSYILETFERDGFEIISPQKLCADILMPDGLLGDIKFDPKHRRDAEKACYIARNIGALDIGQAAVVCNGLVLAVEAQEGTDELLRRVAKLPEELRGTAKKPSGVLAKMVKPGQETRVDLPTIGLKTVELAIAAGLSGIVTEAGQSFVLDRANVTKIASEAGLFIVGLPAVSGESDTSALETPSGGIL